VNTRRKGSLVNSKNRLQSPYSVNDRRRPAQLLEERGRGRPDMGTSLITTLLLSLGLWAAIWGVVASLASVALR